MPVTTRKICLTAFFMIAAQAPAGSSDSVVRPVVEIPVSVFTSIPRINIEESMRREAQARLIQHNQMR